jgi:hypothetical protein
MISQYLGLAFEDGPKHVGKADVDFGIKTRSRRHYALGNGILELCRWVN